LDRNLWQLAVKAVIDIMETCTSCRSEHQLNEDTAALFLWFLILLISRYQPFSSRVLAIYSTVSRIRLTPMCILKSVIATESKIYIDVVKTVSQRYNMPTPWGDNDLIGYNC